MADDDLPPPLVSAPDDIPALVSDSEAEDDAEETARAPAKDKKPAEKAAAKDERGEEEATAKGETEEELKKRKEERKRQKEARARCLRRTREEEERAEAAWLAAFSVKKWAAVKEPAEMTPPSPFFVAHCRYPRCGSKSVMSSETYYEVRCDCARPCVIYYHKPCYKKVMLSLAEDERGRALCPTPGCPGLLAEMLAICEGKAHACAWPRFAKSAKPRPKREQGEPGADCAAPAQDRADAPPPLPDEAQHFVAGPAQPSADARAAPAPLVEVEAAPPEVAPVAEAAPPEVAPMAEEVDEDALREFIVIHGADEGRKQKPKPKQKKEMPARKKKKLARKKEEQELLREVFAPKPAAADSPPRVAELCRLAKAPPAPPAFPRFVQEGKH